MMEIDGFGSVIFTLGITPCRAMISSLNRMVIVIDHRCQSTLASHWSLLAEKVHRALSSISRAMLNEVILVRYPV